MWPSLSLFCVDEKHFVFFIWLYTTSQHWSLLHVSLPACKLSLNFILWWIAMLMAHIQPNTSAPSQYDHWNICTPDGLGDATVWRDSLQLPKLHTDVVSFFNSLLPRCGAMVCTGDWCKPGASGGRWYCQGFLFLCVYTRHIIFSFYGGVVTFYIVWGETTVLVSWKHQQFSIRMGIKYANGTLDF